MRLSLRDGRELASGDMVARGSAENPLGDDEVMRKFTAYAEPLVGARAAARIADRVADITHTASLDGFLDDLLCAPSARARPP